jgi:hypothetical protein
MRWAVYKSVSVNPLRGCPSKVEALSVRSGQKKSACFYKGGLPKLQTVSTYATFSELVCREDFSMLIHAVNESHLSIFKVCDSLSEAHVHVILMYHLLCGAWCIRALLAIYDRHGRAG